MKPRTYFEDFTGRTVNGWHVHEVVGFSGRERIWRMSCLICGKERRLRSFYLKKVLPCKCRPPINTDKYIKKFRFFDVNKVVLECRCLCGNLFYADISDIESGKKESCGCLDGVRKIARQSYGKTYDISNINEEMVDVLAMRILLNRQVEAMNGKHKRSSR